MNYHRRLDRRSLELHRLVAEKPSLLAKVRERLVRSICSKRHADSVINALSEWLHILEDRSFSEVLELLEDPGEEATRLRQSSPFAGLLSPAERKAVLDRFKS
jgi:hypothetical protein